MDVVAKLKPYLEFKCAARKQFSVGGLAWTSPDSDVISAQRQCQWELLKSVFSSRGADKMVFA